MYGKSDHGGLRLGASSAVSHPRPRWDLRRDLHSTVTIHGIRDRPTSSRSPWQNGYAERLIGSVWRECTDHLIAFNADHLRRILAKYAIYYNEMRTHVSLGKDAPCTRPIERFGDWRATSSLRSNLDFGSDSLGQAPFSPRCSTDQRRGTPGRSCATPCCPSARMWKPLRAGAMFGSIAGEHSWAY